MKQGMTMLAAGALAASLAGTAAAKDKAVERKDLPAAVAAAMDRESKGDTVRGYEVEIEHGKTFYELETTRAGRSRELLFDADGTLVEVETEVDATSLPAAVKAQVEKAAGQGGKISAEAVGKGGEAVDYFEIHIHTSLKVLPDGTVLEKAKK